MADFIPTNDTQFNAWLVNLTAAIHDNAALYGISNDISTALQTILPIWQGALADFVREEEAFHAATRNKNEKRAQVEAQVRAINGISQNFPGITEALLEAAGLPVHKAVRAAALVAPPSAPEFEVQHRETQKLNLPFHEGGMGGGALARGKPVGVRAIEFWAKIGPPAPANDPDWAFLQSAQRSPAVASLSQGDIGKPIWIRARWINTRGEPGPWSLAQNTVIA